MSKLMLKNVQLRYNSAFEASQYDEDSKLEYSATVLIPKDHPQVTAILKGINKAMMDFFGKKVPLKRHCLRDGEEKIDKAGFTEDLYFLKAGNDARPPIYNTDGSILTKEDGVIYNGCIVDISLSFWAYDHPKGGKGVSASFRGMKFIDDGEAFGGGVASADEFDFIEGDDPMLGESEDEEDLAALVG